jgi:hypothetical protein
MKGNAIRCVAGNQAKHGKVYRLHFGCRASDEMRVRWEGESAGETKQDSDKDESRSTRD